jgi:hypothetical protein
MQRQRPFRSYEQLLRRSRNEEPTSYPLKRPTQLQFVWEAVNTLVAFVASWTGDRTFDRGKSSKEGRSPRPKPILRMMPRAVTILALSVQHRLPQQLSGWLSAISLPGRRAKSTCCSTAGMTAAATRGLIVSLSGQSADRVRDSAQCSAATNTQHCSGLHMDIGRRLWATIENLVYGPEN